VFTWNELQEINLLLGLLAESLAIDVERAEHDDHDPDAIKLTQENIEQVDAMIERIEQASKQLKQRSPRKADLTLHEVINLGAFVGILELEMRLLAQREPRKRDAHRWRKHFRQAHRWDQVLDRVCKARLDEMFSVPQAAKAEVQQ
jgi:hypothetical protein